jgi:hypothetical protein
MRCWMPSPDEPELFDWWRPLLAVSSRVRAERVPWPVHVDEFAFQGRIDRGPRPAIWVYEHRANGGEVLADWDGRAYEFIRHRSGPSLGRFKEIRVRTAIWRARLPDVVEPIWYDDKKPTPRLVQRVDGSSWHDDELDEAASWQPPAPSVPGHRRHLYVVPPPRNLN